MKVLVLVFQCWFVLLPLRAVEEPFIPASINNFLPTIQGGMTLIELNKSISTAFPTSKIDVVMWRGPIGVLDIKLDERFFLRVYLISREGKELVDERVHFTP